MLCALAIAALATQQLSDPALSQEQGPADVLAPLSASSPDGSVHVVVTAIRGADGSAVAANALVRRPGSLVEWVTLPRPEPPDAVVVEGAGAIHLAYRSGGLGLELVTIDDAGAEIARIDADGLVPVGGAIDRGMPLVATGSQHGPRLGLPLACGSLLLVHFDASEDREPYSACEIVPPARLACGADVWLERARALGRAGDRDGELRALGAALDAAPTDPSVYRALSRHHARTGDLDRRIASLALALERLHPREVGLQRPAAWRVGAPEALLALEYVEAREERGGAREAHAALDIAASLYPTMEQVVLKRAELLLGEGLVDDAVQALDRALAEVDPGEGLAGAYADAGRFLVEAGEDARAIRFLEDAYVLGDRSEFLIRELSAATARLGEHDRAADWLERLADIWATTLAREEDAERRARGEDRLSRLREEIALQRSKAR